MTTKNNQTTSNNQNSSVNYWNSFTRVELRDDPSLGEAHSQLTKSRRAACAFLSEAGTELKMPQLTIATATVFFHRFFAIHTMKDFDKDVVSMASLFLAGKVEETPRKLRHVLEISYKILQRKPLNPVSGKESAEYLELREQVLLHEFQLLQTLAFDLQVEHPYKTLLHYIRFLKAEKELAQIAWNFVNDSLRTTVCLQYPPKVIACACIYLAAKYKRSILSDKWWSELGLTFPQLYDISCQILDLYENSVEMDTLRKGMDKDMELENTSAFASHQARELGADSKPSPSSQSQQQQQQQQSPHHPFQQQSQQQRDSQLMERPRRSRSRSRSRSPRAPHRRSPSPQRVRNVDSLQQV